MQKPVKEHEERLVEKIEDFVEDLLWDDDYLQYEKEHPPTETTDPIGFVLSIVARRIGQLRKQR